MVNRSELHDRIWRWIAIDDENSKRKILKKRERSKVDKAILGEIHRTL